MYTPALTIGPRAPEARLAPASSLAGDVPAASEPVGPSLLLPAVLVAADSPMDRISRALAAWMVRIRAGNISTAKVYERHCRAFLAFIERTRGPIPESLKLITPGDVEFFVYQPSMPDARPLKPSTRAVRAAAVRSMLGAMVMNGILPVNVGAEVKTRQVQGEVHHRAIPQALIVAVLERLAASDKPCDVRDRALIVLALAIGARRHELAGLNLGNLERQADGSGYLAWIGKGNKSARFPLRPDVVAVVDAWIRISGNTGNPLAPLFTNLARRPSARGQRITGGGIRTVIARHFPGYSPHGLRSRSITDVYLNSSHNLGHAQAFSRHSSPGTTERCYISVARVDVAASFAVNYSGAKV